MNKIQGYYCVFILALSVGLMGTVFISTTAHAASYSQLQILLPGETEVPGSDTGKTGSPLTQTVGVPFTISIMACDYAWNVDTTVTNFIEINCSDESATLPGPVSLYKGEIHLTVTLNSVGTFTFSAQDLSDPTIPEAVSSSLESIALQGFEFSRINQKNQYAGVPMSLDVIAVDPNGSKVTGFSGSVRLRQVVRFGYMLPG
jgi:hypothetical protein